MDGASGDGSFLGASDDISKAHRHVGPSPLDGVRLAVMTGWPCSTTVDLGA